MIEHVIPAVDTARDPRTEPIIGAAIEVHRHIGPGMLESVYEDCLARELQLRGLSFERQKELSVEYKGLHLPSSFRMDFLVDDTVVVELKAVEHILPVHEAQLLSYMRMARKPVGLLINFHVAVLKDGIRRRSL